MKKKDASHINDVVQAYMKALKIDSKMKEVRVINLWEEFVGKMVANATKKIDVHKGIMYVHLRSSVVRNELHMIRNDLKRKINEYMKEEIIKDIVLK